MCVCQRRLGIVDKTCVYLVILFFRRFFSLDRACQITVHVLTNPTTTKLTEGADAPGHKHAWPSVLVLEIAQRTIGPSMMFLLF